MLATSWWVVPLLVLGRYSPPFLDWIEAAENTTVSTSLFAALRGAPHWVTYLGPGWWPAGWTYVATPAVVVATAVVAALGLAGLSLRSTPHRLFLGCLPWRGPRRRHVRPRGRQLGPLSTASRADVA